MVYYLHLSYYISQFSLNICFTLSTILFALNPNISNNSSGLPLLGTLSTATPYVLTPVSDARTQQTAS